MFQTSAMDWPLSREEKKSQLIRLYNDDVKAADSMVESGNQALEALREQLDAVRRAAGVHHVVQQSDAGASKHSTEEEYERMRQAVETAAAVLRAIQLPNGRDEDEPIAPPRSPRAKSEGADERETGAVALRPSLCRTPRDSSRPKRRVSFGRDPEDRNTSDTEHGEHGEHGEPEQEPGQPEPVATRDGDMSEFYVSASTSKLGLLFRYPFTRHLHEPIMVEKVSAGSWAEQNDIRPGDMLFSVAGKLVAGMRTEQFMGSMYQRPLKLVIQHPLVF